MVCASKVIRAIVTNIDTNPHEKVRLLSKGNVAAERLGLQGHITWLQAVEAPDFQRRSMIYHRGIALSRSVLETNRISDKTG